MAVYQTLTLTELSVDALANTSRVKVVWKSQQTGQSYNANTRTAKYTITANGETTEYSLSYTLPLQTTKTILSKTFTVPHGEDGSGSVTVRTWMDTDISAGEVELKKTLTLTPIPRASTLSAADAYIGAVATVTVHRKSEQYTHSVAFSFGALSGYLAADGTVSDSEQIHAAGSIPFALPERFYDQLPAQPSGVCTLVCRTYLEGTQIGTDQTAAFTVTADPALCAPVVMGSVADENPQTLALTGSADVLIRYCSTPACTFTAQGQKGASIVSKFINGYPEGESLGADTGSFLFSATDSRGYTTAVTLEKTLIPYTLPTLKASISRRDPTGGEALLTVSGTFYPGSLGQQDNTLCLSYTLAGGEAVQIPVTVDGQSYSASYTLTGLEYTQSYDLTVSAADKLRQTSRALKVMPGVPVFHWGKEDVTFQVPVYMQGALQGASPISAVGKDYPTYAVKGEYDGEELGALTYDAVTNRRFCFRQYAADMDGAATRYRENYQLPSPDSGLTAHQWYNILTTKKPVDISQGGTGATTAEQALMNLGGMKLVKLWENARPSSTFYAQTVSLELSGYDHISIYYKNIPGGAAYFSTGPVSVGSRVTMQYVSTSGSMYHRHADTGETGIVFGAGQLNGEASNSAPVPLVIYGWKGVSV